MAAGASYLIATSCFASVGSAVILFEGVAAAGSTLLTSSIERVAEAGAASSRTGGDGALEPAGASDVEAAGAPDGYSTGAEAGYSTGVETGAEVGYSTGA